MLFALDDNGEKIEAQPKQKAICPFCKCPVLAKCGNLYIWHWAHVSKGFCDDWHESESEWHIAWKSLFPKECVEVSLGEHRADVVTKSGIVIEFQHSTISEIEIKAREKFYGERMMWIIDGEPFYHRLYFSAIFYLRRSKIIGNWRDDNLARAMKFQWKRIRTCWLRSSRPKFIDIKTMPRTHIDRPAHDADKQETLFYWKYPNEGLLVEKQRFIDKYACEVKE
jgi:competence CoiA-like predicted nuclease